MSDPSSTSGARGSGGQPFWHRWMPSQETLARHRWLRWLGPALHHPRLWHMSRRGIAMGCALGVFFGLLIPIAQIPIAAAAAVALRANVPSAVASTLVTNPVTFAPVYYAAWKVGHRILGGDAAEAPPHAVIAATQASATTAAEQAGHHGPIRAAWHRLTGVGKPLVLGLALFATGFGLATWALVNALWWMRVQWRWRRRHLKR
jgi:hypothetical protein